MSASRYGNGGEQLGLRVRHQETDIWADESISLSHAWKHLVSTSSSWVDQKTSKLTLAQSIAMLGRLTWPDCLADGPNIRLGRQDEIRVVSVMSQSARSGVIPIEHNVARGRATSRGCVCVLPPTGSRHDLTTGRRSSCQHSSLFCTLVTFSVERQPTSL